MRFPLVLGPYEAKIVVVGPLRRRVAAPEPSFAMGDTLAEFPLEAPAAQWQKQVTLAARPAGKRIYLECADVNDYARLRVNGKDLAARAWQPYRWDVTDAVTAGANQIEIEVRTRPPVAAAGRRHRRRPPACRAPFAWWPVKSE